MHAEPGVSASAGIAFLFYVLATKFVDGTDAVVDSTCNLDMTCDCMTMVRLASTKVQYFNHVAFPYSRNAAALDNLYGNDLSGHTGRSCIVLATSSVILQAAACC